MTVLSRDEKLKEALREQATRREAAKAKRRKRRTRERPWQTLREDWFRYLRARYGRVIQLSPWGPKEAKLARALVAEVGFETATKMADRFIERWRGEGLPGFGYFWAVRDTYRAFVEGKLTPGRSDLNEDEFSEQRDGDSPMIGW